MPVKQKTAENLNKTILSTALKTFIALLIASVLVFSLFLLIFPSAAGDFLYTMGMKKTAAKMTYRAAEGTEDADKWYASLVRGVAADDYSIIYRSAITLEGLDGYDALAEKEDFKLEKLPDKSFSTKNYVGHHKIKAGVLLYKNERLDSFWKSAVDWTVKNRFPGGPNPMKGYIDALITDLSIQVNEAELLAHMEDLRTAKGVFAGLSYSLQSEQRKDHAAYVARLIRARNWSASEKAKWDDRVLNG